MRHLSIPIIALSLATLLLASCASRQTAATLNDVEAYIQASPDSALATIRAIDTTTLTTRSLRAHYSLLHAMALDKNWIDTTDVNVVMPAVEYYDRHPSGIHRAKAWYYLGRIQQNNGDFHDAGISLLKSEKYSEGAEDKDLQGTVSLSLSSLYSKLHLYEDALNYAEHAFFCFIEANDIPNSYSSMLTRAQNLNHLGRYIEADSLFSQLINNNTLYPERRNDLLCDYALNCVIQDKDYEIAIRCFEEAISETSSLKDWNCLGAYAYALFHERHFERAAMLFKQLEDQSGLYPAYVYAYWNSKAKAYSDDFSDAYRLQVAASDIQKKIMNKDYRQSTIKARKDFLEGLNMETQKKARKKQFFYTSAVFLLLLVILVLFYIIRMRNKQTVQEKESLIGAFIELNSQIEEDKAMIRRQYIQMCRSYFSHVGRINEMLYHYSADNENSLYQELKSSIKKLGSDEHNQVEFETMLNQAFDDVMIHFREAFPNKKPRYYQLVSFLFADFDTTTICTIIPTYNKHNVHVEKSRLKQMIKDSSSSYKLQFLQLLR